MAIEAGAAEATADCIVEVRTLPCPAEVSARVPPARDEERAQPERPDSIERELIDCAGPMARVWLDCESAPCIAAIGAPADQASIDCLLLPDRGGMIRAREERLLGDLSEHARSGGAVAMSICQTRAAIRLRRAPTLSLSR